MPALAQTVKPLRGWMGAVAFGGGSEEGGGDPGGSFTGALDGSTTSLVGAWSAARRLLTSHTGALIRVRRSSDSTELDIAPDAAGDLDAAALAAFVGGSSGYVTRIYDQAGAARDLIQATASSQPRVMNAGVLDTENARPVCVFDGADDMMNAAYTAGGTLSLYQVAKLNSIGSYPMLLVLGDGDIELRGSAASGRPEFLSYGSSCIRATSSVGIYGQYSASSAIPGMTQAWLDGVAFNTAVASGPSSITSVRLGARSGGYNAPMDFSELVLYSTAHDSTLRGGLQTIQKDYFATA
ncbi:MAG: arabinofuranosidase catalytic domain-containing protein [Verrucomicrobiota bacterium]